MPRISEETTYALWAAVVIGFATFAVVSGKETTVAVVCGAAEPALFLGCLCLRFARRIQIAPEQQGKLF